MDAKAKPETQTSGALLTQANLERIRGQWPEAIETCVKILRAEPGNADAHSLLGDINRDQGALEEAAQWYRLAADLRPNGTDAVKLREVEAERSRRGGYAANNAASASLAPVGADIGGTTQLMGVSPRRWLSILTLMSAAFLAATLLVLFILRSSQKQNIPIAHSLEMPSHSLMPTAESGNTLPPPNPNRPTVLPAGELPRQAEKAHETGAGLEPDLPSSSRAAQIGQPARPPAGTNAPPTQPGAQNREVPPAPVRAVQPLNTPQPPSPSNPDDAPASSAPPRGRTMGVASPVTENEKPASENDAGSNALSPEERDRLHQGH
jgi:hypothetical protein